MRQRAAQWAEHAPEDIRQILVSEYQPSAPIGWHRDRPQFGDVIGVSLLAPANFRLRRAKDKGWERRSVPLQPRSIYLLSGEVRQHWQHSIPPLAARLTRMKLRRLSPVPVLGERKRSINMVPSLSRRWLPPPA